MSIVNEAPGPGLLKKLFSCRYLWMTKWAAGHVPNCLLSGVKDAWMPLNWFLFCILGMSWAYPTINLLYWSEYNIVTPKKQRWNKLKMRCLRSIKLKVIWHHLIIGRRSNYLILQVLLKPCNCTLLFSVQIILVLHTKFINCQLPIAWVG